MYGPHTLQEYIQMRNLQRRRENCLLNQAKNFPNALSLDKEKKIDQMVMEIFDYIRGAIGEGPIFQRFRLMMQNLYKTFQRELSEFHNIGVARKFKADQRYIDQMKSANLKLNEYLSKCEEDNKVISEKYQKLAKDNKDNNRNMIMINKATPRVEVEDNFDDEEVVERTEKIGKITAIEPEPKNKGSNTGPALTLKKSQNETNIRVLKPPELRESKSNQPVSKISSFFTRV